MPSKSIFQILVSFKILFLNFYLSSGLKFDYCLDNKQHDLHAVNDDRFYIDRVSVSKEKE